MPENTVTNVQKTNDPYQPYFGKGSLPKRGENEKKSPARYAMNRVGNIAEIYEYKASKYGVTRNLHRRLKLDGKHPEDVALYNKLKTSLKGF